MPRRVPRVRQHDATDCGPACLSSIAAFYGRPAPISRIRQHASSDRGGTNALGLVEAAGALGLTARGVRATPEALGGIPTPAVAHLKLESGLLHYVVLCEVKRGKVVAMDPGEGRIVHYATADFLRMWTGVLIILAPSADPAIDTPGRSVLGRFWELVRPHRSVLLQAMVGATLYTILGLSTAVYVRLVVDHVVVAGNANLLNLLGVGMLVLLVVQAYLGATRSMLALRTGQKIDAVLLLGYYRHLLALPQRFFDTMRVGEVISRMSDAVKIRAFVSDTALDLVVSLLVVLFSFALMFAYNWKLALILALSLPLYAGVLAVTNMLNRKVLRSAMERTADLESQLVESISGIETVKRFGLEDDAHRKVEGRLVALLRPVFRAGATSVFSAQATELTSRLVVILLFWIGAGLVLRNEMSPGALLGFYALIGYLTGPMTQLINANRIVQDALISAERLFEIMDLERERSAPGSLAGKLPPGPIHYQNVRFRYGARRPAVEALDLTIDRGRTTAIVGPSGSGKSTVAALLQRLHAIDRGRISIGGVDLDHLDIATLRRFVAVVPQEIPLFSGSVVENIALDDPSPDISRIISICREIDLQSVIDALPAGLGTTLGVGGVDLSAGQRQKIAIARAVYRDPDILILDEASSNLDALGEIAVQRCLDRLEREGKTIVLIAHRLATAARADRIVVLDEGRVSEEGCHADLLAAGGLYSRLWNGQYPSWNTSEEPLGAGSFASVAP